MLREICEELDEDTEVAKKSYNVVELLDSIIDIISVQQNKPFKEEMYGYIEKGMERNKLSFRKT